MSRLEELQEKLKSILQYCDGWKNCQDGSYEMALHNSGYDRVLKEIKEIREAEQSK
jgi:hypothetical protein